MNKTQDSHPWFSDSFQLAFFKKRACLGLSDGSKEFFLKLVSLQPTTRVWAAQ